MYCLKCGKDTQDGQVFCESCLADMDKYPVKPGTAVQLPRPESNTVKKAPSRKRGPSAEEQLAALRRSNRRLRRFALIVLLLLLLVGGALTYQLLQREPTPAPAPAPVVTTETYRYIP